MTATRGVLTLEINLYSFTGLLDGVFAVPGPSGLNDCDDIHISGLTVLMIMTIDLSCFS